MNMPILLLIVCCMLSMGCADPTTGTFQTVINAEDTLAAAKTTLKLIGFDVQTNSEKEGTIYGNKYAMATWYGPAQVQINIAVKAIGTGSQMQVEVLPPWGAYGTTNIPFDDYAYALKLLIPELKQVAIQRDFQFNNLFSARR
jgi:hypothetical protein